MMKRFLALLLCVLLPLCALAEPVTLGADLSGVICWPEDATEATAVYVYRYQYPTVEGDGEMAGLINEFYAYLVDDAIGFGVPMAAETLPEDAAQSTTNVVSRITCHNENYLSVLVVTESSMGAANTQVYSAQTFPLEGLRAGQVTSLPRVLGILADDEEDTWMMDRQTNKANELVWTLVWDIIQQQQAEGLISFDPDLTYEMFIRDFYPEEDFYLDEEGNLVFFLQAATIASAADGVLLYPFSLEELQDEL